MFIVVTEYGQLIAHGKDKDELDFEPDFDLKIEEISDEEFFQEWCWDI